MCLFVWFVFGCLSVCVRLLSTHACGVGPLQMLLYKLQGIKLGIAPTKNVSRHLRTFIAQCLNVDPNLRYTRAALLAHCVLRCM